MTPLEEVLAGRDERADSRQKLLASGKETFVCQIALNIPGFPKRARGDLQVVKECRDFLLARTKAAPIEERYIENGAGLCWQGCFCASAFAALEFKRASVDAEERLPAGRALDIDVLTQDGAISRRDIGLAARQCLLCEEDAKICAREGRHKGSELRAIVMQIIESAAKSKEIS